MDNYICKRGNKEDLLKRWNYLVDIHPGNNSWIVFRENNIRNFDNNYIIPYYLHIHTHLHNTTTAPPHTCHVKISNIITFIKHKIGIHNIFCDREHRYFNELLYL